MGIGKFTTYTARTDGTCQTCEGPIPQGTTVTGITKQSRAGNFTYRWHPECLEPQAEAVPA